MIKMTKITITRGEGPAGTCNIPTTISTFKEADSLLVEWAYTAPQGGGYDKCCFSIDYEDGYNYSGRYDLKHIMDEIPSLEGHIKSFCEWTAGRSKNPHCGIEKYKRVLESYGAAVTEAAAFLDNYQIGDTVADKNT